MIILLYAIRAEMMKLNRTLALLLIILAPLAVNGLVWLLIMRANGWPQSALDDPWQQVGGNLFVMWSTLMMPLFIVLETALLAGLDHGPGTWKHLYALPVPRWTIYAAKQIIVLTAIGISNIILCLGFWLMGKGTGLLNLKPGMNFNAPFPWSEMLSAIVAAYLAAWLIIAIHTWIAMRWPSFTIAIGVGMVAVLAAVFGANNADWAPYYPWTLPIVAIRNLPQTGLINTSPIFLSLGLALVVMFVGGWNVIRRNINT